MKIVAKTGRPAWCGADRALSEAYEKFWADGRDTDEAFEAFTGAWRDAEVMTENELAAANADGVMEVVK